jgi:two-component system chemotaxis response regulator CheB
MLFDKTERDLVFMLAERLTGVCQAEEFRRDVLLSNVQRRMSFLGISELMEYLRLADTDQLELGYLISALTIHTTSWFRERPHYAGLEKRLNALAPDELRQLKIRMISAACSTGEEVYSFALLLDRYRLRHPGFEYEIIGQDVDPVSVEAAIRCIYHNEGLKQIPEEFQDSILHGEGRATGYFTMSKEIKKRCKFRVQNILRDPDASDFGAYDVVVCRNVLIYFAPANVERIVRLLMKFMKPSSGLLVLGHSEAIHARDFGLTAIGNSTYKLGFEVNVSSPEPAAVAERVRVRHKILVVDDSSTVRQMLGKLIDKSGMDAYLCKCAEEASTFLEQNSVDLITLDLNMPGKDGKTWLLEQRKAGLQIPVVIVSGAGQMEAREVIRALGEGAQDYIDKGEFTTKSENIGARIRAIIEAFARKKNQPLSKAKRNKGQEVLSRKPDIILLGASTGGTEALTRLLRDMPSQTPPVCVVQHISPAFAQIFAERLSSVSGLVLASREEEGLRLKPGTLYMALGDYHIGLVQKQGGLIWESYDIAQVNGHRPSIDKLFQSAVGFRNVSILSILLTGMGRDGARGLTALKHDGAVTVAQDEDSCVIFGMPKEAIRMGGASFVGNIEEIRELIFKSICGEKRGRAA